MTQGHELCGGLADLPEVVICVDWNKAAGPVIRTANKRGIGTVLVKKEPSVVTPGHLKPKVDSLFSRVIEVGRPKDTNTYRWPQTWNLGFFDNPDRLGRTVSINANKFSCLRGELYSLRSKAYSEITSVDLFGYGWDRSLLQDLGRLMKELQMAFGNAPQRLVLACFGNLGRRPQGFLGPSGNKLETLSKYRTALVIENSAEFMSEKLLDSIFAGTIPIYIGPPLEAFRIPRDLVVTAAPNLEGIQQAITRANEMDYHDWKRRAKAWLNQPGVKDSWDRESQIAIILSSANLPTEK